VTHGFRRDSGNDRGLAGFHARTSGLVIKALAAEQPLAELTIVFDEDTDPNEDLGRPVATSRKLPPLIDG
jgi:hypothetical protein